MAGKSSRANEIFASLCETFTQKELVKKFPTVREVRKSFRCGQNVATEALELLAQHFHFCRQKGKAKPVLDFSQFNSWNDFLGRKKECFIALPKELAICWLPLIENFNINSKSHITPRVVVHSEEYNGLIAEGSVDLVILPNHPTVLGINGGLKNFIDLEPFVSALPHEKYYPAIFVKDLAGVVRGIAPDLVPIIMWGNRKYNDCLKDLHYISDLPEVLREIKRTFPEVKFPAVFDSYLNFLCSWGIDPFVSVQNGFSDHHNWECCINCLQQLVAEKLIPPVSDLMNYGFSMFFNGESAMTETFLALVAPDRYNDKYFIRPRLVNKGVQHTVSSEVLAICEGTPMYELAWEFIKFCLSPRMQQQLLGRMNGFSVLKGLKPLKMNDDIYNNIASVLEHSRRDAYENWLTPRKYRSMEFQIDRLVKYGGDIKRFFEGLQ